MVRAICFFKRTFSCPAERKLAPDALMDVADGLFLPGNLRKLSEPIISVLKENHTGPFAAGIKHY